MEAEACRQFDDAAPAFECHQDTAHRKVLAGDSRGGVSALAKYHQPIRALDSQDLRSQPAVSPASVAALGAPCERAQALRIAGGLADLAFAPNARCRFARMEYRPAPLAQLVLEQRQQ